MQKIFIASFGSEPAHRMPWVEKFPYVGNYFDVFLTTTCVAAIAVVIGTLLRWTKRGAVKSDTLSGVLIHIGGICFILFLIWLYVAYGQLSYESCMSELW